MFRIQGCHVLGAVLLAFCITNVQGECNNCVGDLLMEALKEYDGIQICWFHTYKNFLLKEKLYTLEAVLDVIKNSIETNNNLTTENCKTVVPLENCDSTNVDANTQCLMDSMKKLVEAYQAQEQCHGEGFDNDETNIAVKIMKGSIVGWRRVHPLC